MHNTPLKTDAEIYDKITSLYKSNASFIFHMIKSMFPNKKVKRVENFWKINNKYRMCCFSNQLLFDICTVAKIASKKDGVDAKIIEPIFTNIKTPVHQIEQYVKNGKRLAFIGENSDKMFCIQGYSVFCQWIKDRISNDDFRITKIIVHHFISFYEEEIKTRFNLSIRWEKAENQTQHDFEQFVQERIIQGISLNYRFIWEKISGRIQ